MHKNFYRFLVLVTIIVLSATSGCLSAKQSAIPDSASTFTNSNHEIIIPIDSPEIPARGFFMGIMPIPRQGQSFADAYKEISAWAEFVPLWGRPTRFFDLVKDLSGEWGKTFVEQYIRGNGMFPLVHMSFIGSGLTLIVPPGIPGATLTNTEWRKAYKQAAIDVVRVSRPLYFSIGNEVNRWYEKYGARENDPDGFQNFVSLYNEIYDAVKKISPQTKVFCTFAREIVSENREADMTVLNMFDPNRMDILVLTSYPYAVRGIKRPLDIPNDYYARITDYMPGKPLGLSEVGWSSLEAFGGDQAQADFIDEITGRLTTGRGIKLEFIGWPWSSALDDDSIGLIKRSGEERLALETWRKVYSNH